MLICSVIVGRVFVPHVMRLAVSLVLAGLLLGACGYKGPLYLPKPKPEAQRQDKAPAPDAARDATPSQ